MPDRKNRNCVNLAFFYHGSINNKFSGESVYLSGLVSSLREKFNVIIMDGTIPDESRHKDSKIYLLFVAYLRSVRFFINELKKVKQQRVALFVSEDLYISILVVVLAKLSRVKFIYRPSDVGKGYRLKLSKMHFLSPLFYFVSYFSESVLLNFSDMFISVSPKITDHLRRYGIKERDIIGFPFVVKDKITFDNEKISKFKVKYNLFGKIVVIFVGSASYPPNMESILFNIDLAHKLQNMKEIVFLIAGKGTDQIGVAIPSNLIILGAVDDLDTVLFSSHIGLSPSLVPGGLITKVVNYLVHGLLVLSTEEGASGIVENEHLVITDRRNFADKLRKICVDLNNGRMKIGDVPDNVRKIYLDTAYPKIFPDLLYKKITKDT